MIKLLNYLEEAEGIKIHYLEGEKDITAPYGIYKYSHPNANIFKYIDQIALTKGITKDSKYWNESEIATINKAIDKETIKKYAKEFYEEYLKDAHLDLFPDLCKIAMFSMFTNSRKKAWKAVQQSLIDIKKTGSMIFESPLSRADGDFGTKTAKALSVVKFYNGYAPLYFETLMLSNMKSQYIRLAAKNPDKYLKFLKGWDNRMNALSRIR